MGRYSPEGDAVRGAGAPDVDSNPGDTPLRQIREGLPVTAVAVVVLAVGERLDDDREPAGGVGPVGGERQLDAVGHRHPDQPVDGHLVARLYPGGLHSRPRWLHSRNDITGSGSVRIGLVAGQPDDVVAGGPVDGQLGEDLAEHAGELEPVGGAQPDHRPFVAGDMVEDELPVGGHRVQAGPLLDDRPGGAGEELLLEPDQPLPVRRVGVERAVVPGRRGPADVLADLHPRPVDVGEPVERRVVHPDPHRHRAELGGGVEVRHLLLGDHEVHRPAQPGDDLVGPGVGGDDEPVDVDPLVAGDHGEAAAAPARPRSPGDRSSRVAPLAAARARWAALAALALTSPDSAW